MAAADLTSGAVSYGPTLVGEPQAFPRDASWALLIRTRTARGDAGRDLVRVSLADGAESVLATGDLWRAVLLDGDRDAILTALAKDDPTGSALAYQIIGGDAPNDVRATLPTGPNVTWAALTRGSTTR